MTEITHEEKCERARRLIISTQKCVDDMEAEADEMQERVYKMQVAADDMLDKEQGVRNVIAILQNKYDAMVAEIQD